MRTIYKVTDERGQVTYTEDTTEAEGYSRRGFRVTATTGTRQ